MSLYTVCGCARVAVLLLLLLTDVLGQCPSQCRCVWKDGLDDVESSTKPSSVQAVQHVDCSARNIKHINDVLPLDPSTTILDLRANQIVDVAEHQFSNLQNLSIILLDDNHIENIASYAFSGLQGLRTISLTRNRLTQVPANAFSDVAGSVEYCDVILNESNATGSCVINLKENAIRTVHRHAFAWLQRLQVYLGASQVAMCIQSYAFYGARSVARLQIADVPRLTLEPRMFTNTENVHAVDIMNTRLDRLDSFTFEGLKNVRSLSFGGVSMGEVGSYAFSGIHFLPQPWSRRHGSQHFDDVTTSADDVRLQMTSKVQLRGDTSALGGGIVNFTACHFDTLPTDTFADTNLAQIYIGHSRMNEAVQPHVFRGLSSLRSLHVVDCSLGVLPADSLGSLRNVRLINLLDNRLTDINGFAFRDTFDIGTLRIRLAGNLTLHSDAFANMLNIGRVELTGSGVADMNRPGSGIVDVNRQSLGRSSVVSTRGTVLARLTIGADAFRNLVDVGSLRIQGVYLPTLQRNALSGMSKVRHLAIVSCNVSRIDTDAFGDTYSGHGAVESLDMTVGNNLPCDCTTTTTFRDLQHKVTNYSVACRDTQTGSTTLLTSSHVTSHGTPSCHNTAAPRRTVDKLFMIVVSIVVWLSGL